MRVQDYIKTTDYIGYCEIIIKPNGLIEMAQPSHTEKLIALTKKSREEIYDMMPMYASPIDWLVGYTNCVAVWYELYMYSDLTEKQKNTIKKLKNAGCIRSSAMGIKTQEYERCGVVSK